MPATACLSGDLTNLVTLFHNYVSAEYEEESRTVLLSHEQLPAFLALTVDFVTTDIVSHDAIRRPLQLCCVEFWNAIVNLAIVDEARFVALRNVFVLSLPTPTLARLLAALVERVERNEEEAIYFLTLLFEADDFVKRFVSEEMGSVRRKSFDVFFAALTQVLTTLDISSNPLVVLLEALVSTGGQDEGRACLLSDFSKPLISTIALFVARFQHIAEQAALGHGHGDGAPPQPDSYQKLLGLFFRLYGVLHDEESNLFVTHLLTRFGSALRRGQLRRHLDVFQKSELVRQNAMIESEDVDRYFKLMQVSLASFQP
ncbi:hypothetical protein T484DRAFT_1823517 [Baffinella frigidus]|nr:hypothetical protein T484DRAFT_1823517 [Cryptophyta sp. CCMP2293]